MSMFNCTSSLFCDQEIRNSNCGRLMAALVQSRTFATCNHSHLAVGHTHEDVDAVLSVVKRALDSEPVLLTPRDFLRAINKKLEPLFEQQGMTFKTFWVEQEPLVVKTVNILTHFALSTVVFNCFQCSSFPDFWLSEFIKYLKLCFVDRIIYNCFLQQGSWLGKHTSAISLVVECLQRPQAQEEWGGDEGSTIIYIYDPWRPGRNSTICFEK